MFSDFHKKSIFLEGLTTQCLGGKALPCRLIPVCQGPGELGMQSGICTQLQGKHNNNKGNILLVVRSYKALTRRNFKTPNLLAVYIHFCSNQIPIASEKMLLSLYLHSSLRELYLTPTDFCSTISAAFGEAWFDTTQVIQGSAIWFPRGLWAAWFACTVICSRMLTRKCTAQKAYNINYFRPKPQKQSIKQLQQK